MTTLTPDLLSLDPATMTAPELDYHLHLVDRYISDELDRDRWPAQSAYKLEKLLRVEYVKLTGRGWHWKVNLNDPAVNAKATIESWYIRHYPEEVE